MKVHVFHWSALQEDSLPSIHECYLAAFAAVESNKLSTWRLEDTAKRIGVPPEVTWSSEDLWGGRASEARAAFYAKFNELPTLPLRRGAKEMLHRLDEDGRIFAIFSMKTRTIMLREIGLLGVAALAQAYFAPDAGEKPSKENLLHNAEEFFGPKNEFVLVADARYEKTAEALGWTFIEASEDVFANLK